MYNIHEFQPLVKKTLIGFGVLLLILFIAYAATHGTVTLGNYKGSYQMIDERNGKVIEKKSGDMAIFSTGNYTLRIANDNGQYMQRVSVPRFFQSATVDIPQALQFDIDRVAARTLQHLLPAQNSFVSFNSTQRQNLLLRHPLDDPNGLRAKPFTIQLTSSIVEPNNGKLIGFTPVLQSQSDLTPAVYDFRNSTVPTISSTQYSERDEPIIIPSSTANNDRFGILLQKGSKQQLDIFDASQKVNSLKDIENVSQSTGGNLLVGVSKNYIVIGKGSSFLQGDTTRQRVKPDTSDKKLTFFIYSTSDMKEVSRFEADGLTAISDIHITDNGKFVSLLGDQDISIYSTETKSLHYRFNSLFATKLTWLDDNRIVFSSVNNGLFIMNVAQKSSQTLFAAKNFRFSYFSVVDNKIFLTAFSNLSKDKVSTPDGYIVDLSKESLNSNELVNKLPYQTDRVKMTSLGDTIYVSDNSVFSGPFRDANGNFELPGFKPVTTPSQRLLDSAEKHLESFKDRSSYQIIYGRGL